MSAPRHPVWTGEGWRPTPVPELDGEGLVLPNVAALIYPDAGRGVLLLQQRDKPGEPVRGRLEVPGGKWRAGEGAETALRREVGEETGLEVVEILTPVRRWEGTPGWPFDVATGPAVVIGTDGAYPSLHVAFECVAAGRPRARAGETADPRWWPVDEIRELLGAAPDAFTGQSHALLAAVLA